MIAVALACVTFFSTGIGGLAAVRFRDRMHVLLGFSAGAVLGVVFFDLLPFVFARTTAPRSVMLAGAAGFLVFFGLERATSLHRAREHEHALEPHAPEMGLISAVGLSVHSFLDGVVIGIGFQAGSALGLLVALAVIAHDFSDGLNTVTVMLAHGNPLRRSVALLVVDMSTPILGAATTLVMHPPAAVLPWVLAAFCGFFLYIGASDLLPEAREHDSPMVGVATLLGMAALFGVTRFA